MQSKFVTLAGLLLLANFCFSQDTISRQQTCQRLNNVFQSICLDTPLPISARNQGIPGKRGPKGDKGAIGQSGNKGESGVVDYSRVDETISRKFNEQIHTLSARLEELEEMVTNLNKKTSGQREASPTAECTNKWNTEPADYMYIGCYKEQTPWQGTRVVTPVEGRFPTVSGSYGARTNAIEKCAKVAWCLGYKVFVLQAGGWCATSANAHKIYGKYGSLLTCAQDGEGGGMTNAVYMIIG
ncbi:uncharacterized protein LOC144422957 [Styela clava]